MNRTAAFAIARSVRKRAHQGDCPTEPAHHAETIEEALVELLNMLELSQLEPSRETTPTTPQELRAALRRAPDDLLYLHELIRLAADQLDERT